MSEQKLEWCTKLDAVTAESVKRLEELSGMRNVCDRVKSSVWSIFDQFVGALDAFVNQIGSQLVDRFCAALEDACAGSELLLPYTLTDVLDVGAISVEVQSPILPGGEGGSSAGTSRPVPVPLRSSPPPTKWIRDRFKKTHR